MIRTGPGSLLLFRAFGIDVFVHWSWFVVAYILIYYGRGMFETPLWHVLTYLSLFGIVLLHEFGHALACRSVGGRADRIVLWPLGGIAFVQPPQRPLPVLWSIAAGPLVNVLLVPVTVLLLYAFNVPLEREAFSQATAFEQYLLILAAINLMLLVFNLLPVYPLDGGQIVQAILWIFMGQARSLLTVAVFGLLASGVALVIFVGLKETWLAIMALFIGWQSFHGLQTALAMIRYRQGLDR